MNKETIIRKLSSRKFWVCICGFVTSVMTLMKYSDSEAALVTSLITSAGCLIAYILSEGYVDASKNDGEMEYYFEDGEE